MPSPVPPPVPRPGRRSVLRAGAYGVGAVALAPLAGCGIHVEAGSADLPFVPERTAAAGEQALLRLWSGTLTLRDAALAAGGKPTALPAVLAGFHSLQGQVFQDALDRLGVPTDVQAAARTAAVDEATTPAPSTSPTSSATAGATPTTGTRSLGEAEAAGLAAADLDAVPSVPEPLFPAAATALAQRAAAAELLGAPVAWAQSRWSQPTAAQGLLTALWSASYGFEVVVAQSAPASAALAETTLATLRTRRRFLSEVVGDAADPPAPGYALPFPVTTPQAATRLGRHVVGGLRTSLAAALGPVRGQPSGLPDALATLAEAEVLARQWGLGLMAFPGLR